jgi:hypothetical protein
MPQSSAVPWVHEPVVVHRLVRAVEAADADVWTMPGMTRARL